MPTNQPDSIQDLAQRLRAFAEERDWEHFHAPKNLALALSGEVGELAAELQWLREEEAQNLSTEQSDALAGEMADVLIYLVRLADVTGIDLIQVAHQKATANSHRFPKPRQ